MDLGGLFMRLVEHFWVRTKLTGLREFTEWRWAEFGVRLNNKELAYRLADGSTGIAADDCWQSATYAVLSHQLTPPPIVVEPPLPMPIERRWRPFHGVLRWLGLAST